MTRITTDSEKSATYPAVMAWSVARSIWEFPYRAVVQIHATSLQDSP